MVNPAMVKRSAASVAGLAETPISRQCYYADFRQNYDSRDQLKPDRLLMAPESESTG